MKGLKFRFSKKLIFLMMGSVVVLGGGSGAAAVFIGTDKILGPSYLETNGLKCTTLDTVKIKRDQRYWVRKYVVSDEHGDGMARIRTALRVAKAVQEKEHADLVQVAMLDKSGPTDRARMRGRTIGAQVVYIPDLAKAPQGASNQTYSAYYLDGSAAPDGEFYGMRIDLPLEDVEALTARLTDKADCVDPAAAAPAGEHGAPSGHGEKPKKGGDHAKPSGHGESSGHGEASSGHGAAPAAGGHDAPAPAEGHGEEVAAKESGGFLSSITGMIFGSKKEAPAEGHGSEAPAAEHAVAPAGGHDAPAAGHAAPAPAAAAAHGADKPASAAPEAAAPAKASAAGDHGEKPAPAKEQAAVEPKKEEGGFLSSLTGMIFGGDKAEKPAETQAATAPKEPAAEPRTSAEGGKRWSKSTDADAVHGEGAPADAKAPDAKAADAKPVNVEGPPLATDGSTAADAAGAAWLAKMRGQSAAAPAASPAPAAAAPAKPAKPDQEASAKPAKPIH